MALATLLEMLGLGMLGLGRRLGIFIPYRHAAALVPPRAYPALEPLFALALPAMRARIAECGAYAGALAAIGSGGGSAGGPGSARWDQDWFSGLDAAILYTLVRARRPRRLVEIGCGHSTRFAARAVADGGLSTRILAIDPGPRASLAGLEVDWAATTVQLVDRAVFAELGQGDVLFVDSSHVLAPGSDVDLILNDVLARLPAGALVHFHDVFLPAAYPEEWAWRGYNEQNALAALLQGGGWSIVWASAFARATLAGEIARAELDRPEAPPGLLESSLWLEKT